MTEQAYNIIKPETGVPIKAWTKGVVCADAAVSTSPKLFENKILEVGRKKNN